MTPRSFTKGKRLSTFLMLKKGKLVFRVAFCILSPRGKWLYCKKAPSKKAPFKKAPSKKAPYMKLFKKAPFKKAPFEKAPFKKAP